MTQKKNTVIFDLFNVLVRWRHEKAYAKVITDPQRLEFFLQNVIGSRFDYLMEHTSIEEAVIETQKKYPEYADEIAIYPQILPEMFDGYITENLQIIKELKETGVKVYLLSNLHLSAIPMAKKIVDFWDLFDGIIISGEVGASKPEPEIFQILFDRFKINPKEAVFIDDTEVNVQAAKILGLDALIFKDSQEVRAFLEKFSLL